MSANATKALPADVSSLDFQPPCAVTTTIKGRVTSRCSEPAAWLGIPPCGHEDYFCEEHHSDGRSFTCTVCKRRDMLLATYRWIRL
jgi:hypothetical protein